MKAAVIDAVGAGFTIAEVVELPVRWDAKYSWMSGRPVFATPI
jgi:hypothetical protein